MELSDYVTQWRGGRNKLRQLCGGVSAKASRKNRISEDPERRYISYDRVLPLLFVVGIVSRMEKRGRVSPVRDLRRSKFIRSHSANLPSLERSSGFRSEIISLLLKSVGKEISKKFVQN